ncbi:MAG: OmpA family protein [Deltaproteobacteria bacterium]|nr:OmpA family protein [Deltaproteobacteria bacterium]
MRKSLAALAVVCVVACGSKPKPGAKKPVAAPKKAPPARGSGNVTTAAPSTDVEKADASDNAPREYAFDPAKTLPPVSGASQYRALGKPRVVRFGIHAWAGWAPLVLANGGAKPRKVWRDGKGQDFQVELVVVNEAVAMSKAFASGELHASWGSADMLPLLLTQYQRDPRTMPRVVQQVDWSNGGDGIVVRDAIKSVADLRGKSIVLPQSSPAQYFLADTLLDAGLQPGDVSLVFQRDAAQATATFLGDKKHAALVTWSPEIAAVTRPGLGTKVLATTQSANKLIAHLWYARADFARDNPELVEGLVRGILDATESMRSDEPRLAAAKLLDQVFGLPTGAGAAMMSEVHWTNFAANREFFLDANNPFGFERTYGAALQLFRALRVVDAMPSFQQLADVAVLRRLAKEPIYASQRNLYESRFTPIASIEDDGGAIVKAVRVRFAARSSSPDAAYDPDLDATLEHVAALAKLLPGAKVLATGHTDASLKGSADEAAAKELSLARATEVRDAIVAKYELDPDRFVLAGAGWDTPADPGEPSNHAKNRRVELRVVRDADRKP